VRKAARIMRKSLRRSVSEDELRAAKKLIRDYRKRILDNLEKPLPWQEPAR